jgi:hypothetical protein
VVLAVVGRALSALRHIPELVPAVDLVKSGFTLLRLLPATLLPLSLELAA